MEIEEASRLMGVEEDSINAAKAVEVFNKYEDALKRVSSDNQNLSGHIQVLLKLVYIFCNRYLEKIGDEPHTKVMEDLKRIFHDNNIDWNIYSAALFVAPKSDVVVQEGGRSDVEKRLNNVQ